MCPAESVNHPPPLLPVVKYSGYRGLGAYYTGVAVTVNPTPSLILRYCFRFWHCLINYKARLRLQFTRRSGQTSQRPSACLE